MADGAGKRLPNKSKPANKIVKTSTGRDEKNRRDSDKKGGKKR